MKQLRGIIPALLTAANEDGSINDEGIRSIVEQVIQKGAGGVFALGSCGECSQWSFEQKAHVIDVVMETVKGRVPVIAGCGAPSTRETLELCKMAEQKHVDYLAVVTPYYITPTQDDLYEHYRIIAEKCSVPILLYNIPSRTNVTISPELLKRLKQVPGIVGIKDSSGDLDLFRQYMELDDESFIVIQGIDRVFLDSFKMGARAAVSGPANVVTQNQVQIYENYTNGNLEQAEYYQERFTKLKEVMGMAPSPTALKEAANVIGLKAGPPALPLRRPTGDILKAIQMVMHEEFMDEFVS